MFLYTNFQFQDQEKLCCSELTAGWLWNPSRFLWKTSWWNAVCAGKHNHDTETSSIPTRFPVISFKPLLLDTVKWSGRILDSLLMSMNELIIHQIATITENNKHARHIYGSWHLDVHSEDYWFISTSWPYSHISSPVACCKRSVSMCSAPFV